MNLHLVEIAATVAPGAHAVLLVDQAGWHLSTGLVVPPNITIMALPPKCPELNPVENVWQFLRDNWLSNRVFKSYDDLVDHCCVAWNKLVNQPWRIMSIGLRQWAHGFVQAPLAKACFILAKEFGLDHRHHYANGRTSSDQWDSVRIRIR